MDMLNSCGLALSQRDGSDFHSGCNWEVRAWRQFALSHRATPAWTYYGSPEKLEKKYENAGRCNQLWEESEMGMQRKIGYGI